MVWECFMGVNYSKFDKSVFIRENGFGEWVSLLVSIIIKINPNEKIYTAPKHTL